jgi:UPF0716 protein FxsA
MRLLLLLIILLAFPALELVLLVELAGMYGWWVLAYVIFSALLGWLLIKGERLVAIARIFQTVQNGEHPIFALLSSAKTLAAGALLIFPGVISDILALLLLIFPVSLLRRPRPRAELDADIIETEWRRED